MKAPLNDLLFRLRGTEDNLIAQLRRRRELLQHATGFPNPSQWSQRALAKYLGVTKNAVSQWEGGYAYPTTLALLENWAQYLGMKLIIDLKAPVAVSVVATWREENAGT